MRAFRGSVTALVAGVMAFFLLAGGGAAWAFWTATANGTGQANTLSVAVTETNFNVLRATYTNTHTRLTSTGSFTITNTGEVAGVASTRISATGTVAPQMPLRMWPVASATACTAAATIPTSAISGTWASAAIEGTTLAAGASQIFCVRTTVPVAQRNALASTTGTVTVPGTLNVSLVGTGTGWTATSIPGSAPQRTEAIYPLDTSLAPANDSRWFVLRSGANSNVCLDVASSGGAGANVISWTCTLTSNGVQQANQFWQAIPVSEADRTLVTLRPRHSPATRLSVDASGRQVLAAANTALPAQQWYVQRVSATTVQFVSASNGQCLSVPGNTANSAMSLVDCTTTASALVTADRVPLNFTGGISTTTLLVGTSAAGAGLALQRYNPLLGNWDTMTTTTIPTSGNSTGLRITSNLQLGLGDNTMRIVFPDGSVAYSLVINYNLLTGTSIVSGNG